MKLFGTLFTLFILFTACSNSSESTKNANFQLLDGLEFQKLLQENPEATLLDVRTAEEFNEGHIANAQNVPIGSSELNALTSSLDQTKPVFVYCLSGGRSASASRMFQEAGFQTIIEQKKWYVELACK